MYDLVAVLDWNRDPVASGKGSAIFLHVWKRPRHPTAGCIAFRRQDLEWILRRWTTLDRVVVRGTRSNPTQPKAIVSTPRM
jgi:L,D-peptidoglycan transpeptidase YkuD (ErfK/YbiS/YcfS/YnhG family)